MNSVKHGNECDTRHTVHHRFDDHFKVISFIGCLLNTRIRLNTVVNSSNTFNVKVVPK